MILDLFIYIIQFYINQNTFLPGFIIRKERRKYPSLRSFTWSEDPEKSEVWKFLFADRYTGKLYHDSFFLK